MPRIVIADSLTFRIEVLFPYLMRCLAFGVILLKFLFAFKQGWDRLYLRLCLCEELTVRILRIDTSGILHVLFLCHGTPDQLVDVIDRIFERKRLA